MDKKVLQSKITYKLTKKRLLGVATVFFLALCYLFYNLFTLQYVKHDYYVKKTYDQITTSSVLSAERGKIYDRDLGVLATDRTVWRIFVSTRDIKKAEKNEY